MSADLTNGIFEFVAALFQMMNVLALQKDKKIRGVRFIPTLFFSLWGFWNLYYYPHLHQPFSLIGGICMAFVNVLWLILMFRYRDR